jgi:hypothetical protein
MIAPVFQVTGLKEGFDEPQKATIMDFLSQDGQQDLMIEGGVKVERLVHFQA